MSTLDDDMAEAQLAAKEKRSAYVRDLEQQVASLTQRLAKVEAILDRYAARNIVALFDAELRSALRPDEETL